MGATRLMFPKIYDGKRLWEVYTSMGAGSSYEKLRVWAQEKGMTNPKTGQANTMGVYWAIWKYAFQNPDEAFPLWKEWAAQYPREIATSGFMPTWENFIKQVEEKARRREIASKKDYREFCEKYKDILKPHVPEPVLELAEA